MVRQGEQEGPVQGVKRSEGIHYLTHDAETGEYTGWLGTPGCIYGRNGDDCAPVAWRLAYVFARESSTEIDHGLLDWAMGLVVNSHDDVAYYIKTYGYRHYT